ncbi:MAG TPA: hypothetical protein ENJ38_06375 [Rhodospirillales bacterium]|nr:hypothetical protein [Rhodospirillales bacterium]
MTDLFRYVGQAVFYAVVVLAIGYFSQRPIYEHIPPDKAQILLSFSHGGARVEACRRLSAEEIARLPPRERRPNTCSRRRVPIRVQLVLDEEVIFDRTLEPGGLAGDSPAHAYEKFLVPVGRHRLVARLEDRGRSDRFAYESELVVDLRPRQNLPIDFKADKGGFIFYL